MRNFYEILGVVKTASPDEIRKAYRRLALEYHPDRRGPRASEELFKEVGEAYRVLNDPAERVIYDRLLQQAAEEEINETFTGFGGSTLFALLGTIPPLIASDIVFQRLNFTMAYILMLVSAVAGAFAGRRLGPSLALAKADGQWMGITTGTLLSLVVLKPSSEVEFVFLSSLQPALTSLLGAIAGSTVLHFLNRSLSLFTAEQRLTKPLLLSFALSFTLTSTVSAMSLDWHLVHTEAMRLGCVNSLQELSFTLTIASGLGGGVGGSVLTLCRSLFSAPLSRTTS